jgi:hypothetical protein
MRLSSTSDSEALGAARSMVCLFHGDYGPADPGFVVVGPTAAYRGWRVDPILLKDARNIGEAEAIQRHVLKGEAVSWCHQGYSWVDQPAIGWLYIAALVFVVLPYLVMKSRTLSRRFGAGSTPGRSPEGSRQLRS